MDVCYAYEERSKDVSRSWGLLQLAVYESDLMMLVLVFFILAALAISIFMAFSLHIALLVSGALVVGLIIAVHETKRMAKTNEDAS
jgi:uncharacterized membrane-anchored protein